MITEASSEHEFASLIHHFFGVYESVSDEDKPALVRLFTTCRDGVHRMRSDAEVLQLESMRGHRLVDDRAGWTQRFK